MLALYAALLKTQPQLRFLILSQDVTDGLKAEAEAMGIPNSYLVHVSAERKEVPALMSLMKASVFFILPAYSKKASSPTKQGELMAMGVPVICNDRVGDTGEIIRTLKAGHVLSGFTNAAFDQVGKLWNSITTNDPDRIRKGAETYFSLQKGITSYAGVYSTVLKPIPET
jgi:glycosyltransferase involved in cell wall biosynthesis